MHTVPAILGGEPAFAENIPVVRPTIRSDGDLIQATRQMLDTGMLTNGNHVQEFESEAAPYLGVEHVVAVASCTVGLMLLLRCLGIRGAVVIPSFTFMATAHAARWNGLDVRFADSDPLAWTLDPESASAAATSDVGAFIAVHTFGAPCDLDGLQRVADQNRVPLLLDAAHGFGARYPDGSMVGTGAIAEVFSLSPTKPLSTGEGGLIATNDGALARELKIGRDYGNPGDYDSAFVGLNGRMNEFAAILGRSGLAEFPEWIERRRTLAARYAENLADVSGVYLQQIAGGSMSSYKDLSVRIESQAFGLDRDAVAACLAAEGISTRQYFNPPVHQQQAYRCATPTVPLPVTDRLATEVLTLPLYSHLPANVVDVICGAIRRIHEAAPLIAQQRSEIDK